MTVEQSKGIFKFINYNNFYLIIDGKFYTYIAVTQLLFGMR